MAQVWKCVGGADKGGIVVRGLDGKKLDDRLSTGALVEEVSLAADGRLTYKLLEGTGPAEGSVAVSLPDKELMVKVDRSGPPDAPPETAASEAPASEAAAPSEAPAPLAEKAAPEPGSVEEMIKIRCDKEIAKPPLNWNYINQDLVTNNHMRKAPGMAYGIEFAWNEATLEEMGPEWLTKAMHTVGSLPETNRVTAIILEKKIKVTTGNNGGKFLFEVEYANDDGKPHTKLFAKVPFPLEGKTVNDRMSSSVNKQPAELYEVNAYRLLEASLPMKTPRFYFGDISNETSNWIIITERINFHDFNGNNFGKPAKETPKPLPPFEIEGPYDKCIDYNLRGKPADYYMLLTRKGARMAGLAKAGAFGSEEMLSQSFRASPPPDPTMWGVNPGAATGQPPKQVKALLDNAIKFVTETGKVLFQKYTSQQKFLDKFRRTMMTVNAYNSELNFWQHMNWDYVALGHMNLNVDNAYFWRDADGKLDCGAFDWGGMGTSSFGTKLWWWYYCMDYSVFKMNLKKFLQCFCDEYHAGGGPKIDPKEMEPMVIISAIQQMHGLVAAVPQIMRMCPKKEWETIKDRYDPRIALNIDDKSTIRLYLHCMDSIMRIIEEMKGDKVVETWIKDIYVGKMGQTPKSDELIGM